MSHDRYLASAQRVLDGDESVEAANELKDVVVDEYREDDRVDELVEVLTRYAESPGTGGAVPEAVRTAIRETTARLM